MGCFYVLWRCFSIIFEQSCGEGVERSAATHGRFGMRLRCVFCTIGTWTYVK
jgi:hypothetical protein